MGDVLCRSKVDWIAGPEGVILFGHLIDQWVITPRCSYSVLEG
jgi:hypothetical protein